MTKNLIIIIIGIFLLSLNAFSYEMEKVDIHGFISQGYMKSEHYNWIKDLSDGTFQFNEMGINFTTKVTPDLRLGIQLFSKDFGDIGNDELVVDWAFADYNFNEWLGIRGGRMKIPHGLYNETRDVDAVRTSVLLNQAVYWDMLRDSHLATNGIGAYGNLDLYILGSLSWQLMGGSNNIPEDGGTAAAIIAISPTSVPKIDQFQVGSSYCGALKWYTPLPGLILNLSDTSIDVDSKMKFGGLPFVLSYQPYRSSVYSLEYMWNDLIFVTEYMRADIDYKAILTDLDLVVERGRQEHLGWYSSLSYRINGWLETGLSYSEFYDDRSDRDGSTRDGGRKWGAWQKDLAVSLRFDLNDNWIIKAENHFIYGNNQVIAQYMNNDPNSYEKQRWYMYAIKLSYVF